MSRNVKKVMKSIFDKIKDYYIQTDIPLPQEIDKIRFISGSTEDKEYLCKSKIVQHFQVSHNLNFGIIKHNEISYFFCTGMEYSDKIPPWLDFQELNSGIFSTVIYELDLAIKQDAEHTYIEENILSISEETKAYDGHNFIDLSKIFPNIFVAIINQNYPGKAEDLTLGWDLHQMISLYIIDNEKLLLLKYSSSTLSKIYELLTTNSEILNYEGILNALLSSSFKFAFLDFYRCIEFLFTIIYIDEIHIELNSAKNKSEILNIIQTSLKWIPKERETVIKIVDKTPPNIIGAITTTISTINGSTNNVSVGNWIYDIRCDIVHLRKVLQANHKFSIEEWDMIIKGIVDILIHWYKQYPNFI